MESHEPPCSDWDKPKPLSPFRRVAYSDPDTEIGTLWWALLDSHMAT